MKVFKEELFLNDCLEIGNNYILFIFVKLVIFRSNLVGFIVDFKKVFLMMSIKEEE